jgi:hypothetical protein
MFTIKSPLKYFPISVGDYTLKYNKVANEFRLLEKNHGWMGYDQNSFWQSTEFYIEIEQAYGTCITTGLGLGILQAHLCLKDSVTKVVVYEKSKEVIEIFHKIIDYNNFDISKIEIRNEDADHFSGEVCDCLFPDHFDSETEDHIINIVKKLSQTNTADIVWYWPAAHHFFQFVLKNRIEINSLSYDLWKKYTNINNLPEKLDEETFLYLDFMKKLYLEKVSTRLRTKLDTLVQRNSLLELSKKLR